jgi:hypothetical protein
MATTYERDDLAGTEKSMSVNEPDDGTVTFRELHRGNLDALEAWQAFLH